MSEIDYSQFVTYAQFAEKAGTTPQTVQKWAEAAGVKPVIKAGNTNVYLVSDLQSAMESFSTNAKAFKALGYVHPDLHKAIEDHRDRLIQVTIERDAEIMDLRAELENLRDRDAHLTALEAAGVNNWDGYVGAPVAELADEDILAKAEEFGVTILTDV